MEQNVRSMKRGTAVAVISLALFFIMSGEMVDFRGARIFEQITDASKDIYCRNTAVGFADISSDHWYFVAARGAHTIALKADGTIWTWGYNRHGQLGDGTTVPKYFPNQISTDSSEVFVVAEGPHTASL